VLRIEPATLGGTGGAVRPPLKESRRNRPPERSEAGGFSDL